MSDVDPNDQLAPLPDIGVDWPDLATAPGEPTAAASNVAASFRYGWRIDGVDAIGGPLLRQRFRELSVLAGAEGKEANAAQLDRRARQDADLLVTLLKGDGYYDVAVATRVEREKGRPVVVLAATRNTAAPQVAGLVIGFALTVVHLIGIPLTGTSVNPARSIGPALVVEGSALSQLWVFVVAPLVGGALAALAHNLFYPAEEEDTAVRLDVADAVPDVGSTAGGAAPRTIDVRDGAEGRTSGTAVRD